MAPKFKKKKPVNVETHTYNDGELGMEIYLENGVLIRMHFQILPGNVAKGRVKLQQVERLYEAIGELIQRIKSEKAKQKVVKNEKNYYDFKN